MLQTKPKVSNDVVPFVVTYNPALPRISNILRKHFNILHSSNRCKDVFKQPPYRRSPNLRDILVKAQLSVISNNHFPPGSFRCGLNCATCPKITNGLTRYTFYATGETRSITSHITCNTKNVIYMAQCNRCNLQYVGETKRRVKDRFYEHTRAVDKTNIREIKIRQLRITVTDKHATAHDHNHVTLHFSRVAPRLR